jgi:uncharacterized protein (TIGR02301 family)
VSGRGGKRGPSCVRPVWSRTLVVAAFATALSVSAASAQTVAPAAPPRLPPPPAATTAPYDADLLQLAQIMGALHFLEQLCDGAGTSAWRDQMAALLAAEQPDDRRRARLVDSFNRGFESYRSVYRECTDSARLAITRYEDQGAMIAADLDAKYGRG